MSSASPMPLVVSFVGVSGKTTVIEQLIPRVAASGLRVGTVKHASHGHEVDRIGSDSWRHRHAGAEVVLLAGASGAVVFLAEPSDAARDASHHHTATDGAMIERLGRLVETHLVGMDVVLAEGFAPVHDLLVNVSRAAVGSKEPAGSRTTWLAITDAPSGDDEYGFGDLDAVAARIVDEVRRRTALD
jgi:molybdopterin-guanine dinucleotide biosynthesis adapter protein